MARTWRFKRYPASGFSLGTAGLVYSKAPLIIRAFSDGAMIKSDKGMFLAIPTAAAPKRGVGGKRINPDNFPEHSLGRLRFVYRKGQFRPLFAGGDTDLAFSANVVDYLKLIRREEDPDTLFFNRKLQIEGDTELGLVVKNWLDSVERPPRLVALLHVLIQ